MSVQLGKVVSLIINERFGAVVEKVATYLFSHGTSPLFYIKKYTDLPLSKIKESLCILIKYQLVTFLPNKNEDLANYTLHHDRVLLMLRYPKYINIIKKKFGDECEMIVEEILQRSYWTAAEVILKVFERLTKSNVANVSLPTLKDHFKSLVIAKYIKRLPYPADEKSVPTLILKEDEAFAPPSIDVPVLAKIQKDPNSAQIPDKNLYWTINFDRFHQDMRDKLIYTAFTKKFDENAGEFMKLLLQQMYIRTDPWADISNPVPLIEIKDIVRNQMANSQLHTFFDQYVNVIEQDSSRLIAKAGEASGGSFQIYLKEIYRQLVWETIEQIVLEKFDTKAARIFRLVKAKKYIEPDQIQQLAMIPGKEAKKLSYQLVEEGFFHIQELRKAVSSGPNKSFTLFYIQVDQTVRMILEMCYKTLFNTMTRRNYEKVINKRIIDKKQRVDTIAMGMRAQGATEEQLADIEEMITPPEKEILANIDKIMKKLNIVEFEVDDTMFLLQLYLKYN